MVSEYWTFLVCNLNSSMSSGPFNDKNTFGHLNSELVCNSDPDFTFFTPENFVFNGKLSRSIS